MTSIVSWSGGKDSCLALWRAQSNHKFSGLLTALDETGLKARSHGVSRALLQAQARALGLPCVFFSSGWKDYEAKFIQCLQSAYAQGAREVVFGDIDLQAHRDWEEKVCGGQRMRVHLPLWGENRLKLVYEFLAAGFKARVVCVDARFLDASFVGREFDLAYIDSLPPGVDACGENGEFHTFVYDGPNFSHPVAYKSLGLKTSESLPVLGKLTYHFDLLDI